MNLRIPKPEMNQSLLSDMKKNHCNSDLIKYQAFHNELQKFGVKLDLSNHFWERVFERPAVREDFDLIKRRMAQLGGKNMYIEDIPQLSDILKKKDKRFLVRSPQRKSQFIFAVKKDRQTGKHYFVSITGLPNYMSSYNLEDITSRIFPRQ